MKKIIKILGLTILSSSIFAQTQVPNADFENWTLYKPDYNYYAANDWSDGASCFRIGGSESCTFLNTRTTEAQSGLYAIQQFDRESGLVNSLPFYNNVDETSNGPAFTGRPKSVSFYYKYATDDNEPMEISFLLYAGDLMDNPTEIATAKFEFSTVQKTYKKVDLDFTYTSSAAPTNIYIISDFATESYPATAFDTLTWDNIVFNYNVATDVTNPASPDYFTVSVSNKVLSTSKSIDNAVLVDLAGKNAASFNHEGTIFNVEQLKTGIYILTGMVNDTPFSRKVIIE